MHYKNEAGFIVIGGGILGASTAFHLANNGKAVTLVDRKDTGQATDAAAGIVCPWLSQRRNKAWYKLAKGGAKIYPEIIEKLRELGETDTGYERVGAISLHTEEKKLTAMKERALKRREDAPEMGEITMLSEEETRQYFPLIGEGYSAVHVSGAARVDGRKLRDALIRGAEKLGAQIVNGDASLVTEGGTVTGVRIDHEIFEADTVIATTGAWMGELFKPLGIGFDVQPQRAQLMHLKLEGHDTAKWPVVIPPTNQYMLAFDDQRLVIGATHEDETGFDARITAGGLYEVLSKALQVSPQLAHATVLETRVGFRPVTPGFLPVVGSVPGVSGLFVANGLGASGLTMGPYIGAQLSKLAQGLESEIDPANYPVGEAIRFL
ncbi:NAD(P)/FAD-dependent oxidoreductase [Oceanobacillus manasiensis]|uniref:NAD(P)/FAD-dependent oxidoreductase n=1 Tax=Oceanobacillus manasiensis TaxID=586413 RepID=UPI0005A929A9|nr:FAD-binding oxidoreductase [Oceanobacillus manasiensis]